MLLIYSVGSMLETFWRKNYANDEIYKINFTKKLFHLQITISVRTSKDWLFSNLSSSSIITTHLPSYLTRLNTLPRSHFILISDLAHGSCFTLAFQAQKKKESRSGSGGRNLFTHPLSGSLTLTTELFILGTKTTIKKTFIISSILCNFLLRFLCRSSRQAQETYASNLVGFEIQDRSYSSDCLNRACTCLAESS